MPSFLWPLVNALQAVFLGTWSAIWISAALGVRLLTRSARTPLAMARYCWAPGLLRAGGMRLQVEGLDHVDWTKPHFFAANHQSIVDVLALYRALPTPLLFVLKEELRRVPFLGWYVAAMGMIFLPRDRRRQSLESLSQCEQRIAEGYSVLIFPEGTRSLDRRLGPLKPGMFLPAIDTGVPIVPVLLSGTGKILPPGGFRLRPGVIRVRVGRPVPTAGRTRDDRRAVMEEVREAMLAME